MTNDPITPEVQSSPDAVKWADAFVKAFPDADEATMIGWFANAMMAMHDWQERKKIEPLKEEIERLRAIAVDALEAISRNCQGCSIANGDDGGGHEMNWHIACDAVEALNAKGEG